MNTRKPNSIHHKLRKETLKNRKRIRHSNGMECPPRSTQLRQFDNPQSKWWSYIHGVLQSSTLITAHLQMSFTLYWDCLRWRPIILLFCVGAFRISSAICNIPHTSSGLACITGYPLRTDGQHCKSPAKERWLNCKLHILEFWKLNWNWSRQMNGTKLKRRRRVSCQRLGRQSHLTVKA